LLAGLAVVLVGGLVAVVLVRSGSDDVGHLEEIAREVAAVTQMRVTSVESVSECETESSGALIPRFVDLSGPGVDDLGSFIDALASGLERKGYDDVEVVSESEVQAVRGAVSVQVLASDQSTRVRAIDPLSAC